MPRPCKRRRICAMPGCRRFGPTDGADGRETVMTIDEYETVRLIDLEGMTQEECAARMNVARTTAQAIYAGARAKLAECLVNGSTLLIDGGDYVLCDGSASGCERRRCGCRGREIAGSAGSLPVYDKLTNERQDGNMKIAVTYENGSVFQHFGHTESFKLYVMENGKIVSSEIESTNGSGHSALADFLKERGVNVLICGGIGGGARQALDAAGIRLYGGVSGDADAAVQALMDGKLSYDPDVMCSHHEEHHGDCGGDCSHHCG